MVVSNNLIYYISLHLRFSTLFYSTQLVDIFAYEILTHKAKSSLKKSNNSVLVYNFHNLNFNTKFFFFTKIPSSVLSYNNFCKNDDLALTFSITELFFAAN
jgi:hypothetical protein